MNKDFFDKYSKKLDCACCDSFIKGCVEKDNTPFCEKGLVLYLQDENEQLRELANINKETIQNLQDLLKFEKHNSSIDLNQMYGELFIEQYKRANILELAYNMLAKSNISNIGDYDKILKFKEHILNEAKNKIDTKIQKCPHINEDNFDWLNCPDRSICEYNLYAGCIGPKGATDEVADSYLDKVSDSIIIIKDEKEAIKLLQEDK